MQVNVLKLTQDKKTNSENYDSEAMYFIFYCNFSFVSYEGTGWLDISQRVQYKLGVTVHRCLQNKAPQYLMDYCTRTSDVSSRQRLTSANRHQLMIPRHCRSTFGCRAFSVAGPIEWNSLPHSFRGPARSTGGFRSALKTHLFAAQRDD